MKLVPLDFGAEKRVVFHSNLNKEKTMKRLLSMAIALMALCAMAEVTNVTITTEGPRFAYKMHDVFVVRYQPMYRHGIGEVYFHGDLQPFARIDKGTYWVFLFDAVFDGKFHGTEALISDIGYSVYRPRPYWPEQYLSTTGSWIGEVAGKTGFMAHPVDGSGPTCFGWKSLDVVTNYYPVIIRKTGTPLIFVDLSLVADDVPRGAIVCYGVVQTNINVRLDAKWDLQNERVEYR